jgi:hypothetical protein
VNLLYTPRQPLPTIFIPLILRFQKRFDQNYREFHAYYATTKTEHIHISV